MISDFTIICLPDFSVWSTRRPLYYCKRICKTCQENLQGEPFEVLLQTLAREYPSSSVRFRSFDEKSIS